MILHSTTGKYSEVSFAEGIVNGLAPDGGLYMPASYPTLPLALFRNICEMKLQDIAYVVYNSLFSDILSSAAIKRIVDEALNFNIPLTQLDDNKYVLELYHGPTHSFKDVGARLMAQLLPEIVPIPQNGKRRIILASSGDSGGAMANAFKDMPSTSVIILYPKGELTNEQILQFVTIENVIPIEVNGSYDECQSLVKAVLQADTEKKCFGLTSGNSINLARELPSIIYFFHAYARAIEAHKMKTDVVISIPCGNLGSLAAALMAKKMGLPISRFLAVNNANDVFVEYLKTGNLVPQKALLTLARAMDVGNPSNIARIIDLYGGNIAMLRSDVEGYSYNDAEIVGTMRNIYQHKGILLDPQGAAAVRAIEKHVAHREVGVALACANPTKIGSTIANAIGIESTQTATVQTSIPVSEHRRIIKIPPTIGALHKILATNT